MPVFETSQEWLHQSTLLFQAYPTTSRVTTKYTIHPPKPPSQRKRKRQPGGELDAHTTDPAITDANAAKPLAAPTASLTLKTYDPVSGVCLKYRTAKGAEVGRLIASLGKLGKHIAARPDADAEEVDTMAAKADAAAPVDAGRAATTSEPAPAVATQPKAGASGAGGGGGSGGGNKKKKKGKK